MSKPHPTSRMDGMSWCVSTMHPAILLHLLAPSVATLPNINTQLRQVHFRRKNRTKFLHLQDNKIPWLFHDQIMKVYDLINCLDVKFENKNSCMMIDITECLQMPWLLSFFLPNSMTFQAWKMKTSFHDFSRTREPWFKFIYLQLQSLVWRFSFPWSSWKVLPLCCSPWWHTWKEHKSKTWDDGYDNYYIVLCSTKSHNAPWTGMEPKHGYFNSRFQLRYEFGQL